VKEENKGDYNYYKVSVNNVPVLNKETYQAYNTELMRLEYVLGYIKSYGKVRFNTYSDFSKNVYKNTMEQQKESLKDIKKLSKLLKLDAMSDEEAKIRTIENWVKTNIVYSDGVGFSKMSTLLKNKYAGENGLIRLYIYMFEYNEIKYQLWVTCDKSEKTFDEDFESYNFLQNFYFYFPKLKKFIDFKNVAWRLSLPPSAILGQKAVQIKVVDLGNGVSSSKYSIGKAKTPSCNATNAVMNLDISLDAEMNKAKIKYHAEENGYENFIKALYTLVTDEQKRKELMEEHVKLVSKDAEVTNVKVKNHNINNIETFEKPVIIDADMTLSKIIESAGDKTILKIGELIGEQQELYSDKPRQTKIVDNYPHMYSRTLVVHIPDGYTVKGLEKFVIKNVFQNTNGDQTDSIGFVCNYVLEGNTLTITCTEYYEMVDWPKEKYEQYRTVINSAADFNKLSIILDPKK
jgi:S-adenosylmethionine/arginine decarboxylase-like enzyme